MIDGGTKDDAYADSLQTKWCEIPEKLSFHSTAIRSRPSRQEPIQPMISLLL